MSTRHERRGAVMGGTFHLVTIGGSDQLLDAAVERLGELERKWSRFRADSELSLLNASGGVPCIVSTETAALVERACIAWERTGGRFDPTVHDSMVALGYDADLPTVQGRTSHAGSTMSESASTPAPRTVPRTVAGKVPETVPGTVSGIGTTARSTSAAPAGGPSPGCAGIECDVAVGLVQLPPGVRIDPGGIGKGFAADLVTAALLDAGAAGALVNLGGDLRAAGDSPIGGWRVAIEAPVKGGRLPLLRLTEGAVATSGIHKRRWAAVRNGESDITHHHLVDPRTGHPVEPRHVTVTAVTDEAWWAEAQTKAAFVDPCEPIARSATGAAVASRLIGVHPDGAVEEWSPTRGLGAGSSAWRELWRESGDG